MSISPTPPVEGETISSGTGAKPPNGPPPILAELPRPRGGACPWLTLFPLDLDPAREFVREGGLRVRCRCGLLSERLFTVGNEMWCVLSDGAKLGAGGVLVCEGGVSGRLNMAVRDGPSSPIADVVVEEEEEEIPCVCACGAVVVVFLRARTVRWATSEEESGAGRSVTGATGATNVAARCRTAGLPSRIVLSLSEGSALPFPLPGPPPRPRLLNSPPVLVFVVV